jgi:hypothetical protein
MFQFLEWAIVFDWWLDSAGTAAPGNKILARDPHPERNGTGESIAVVAVAVDGTALAVGGRPLARGALPQRPSATHTHARNRDRGRRSARRGCTSTQCKATGVQ